MKKYIITVENIQTYKIIAEDEKQACDKAKELFNQSEATYYIESEKEIPKTRRE